MNIKERIRKAGPTTRTVRVWLGADLDVVDEFEAAERALEVAQKPGDSLAGNGSVADATERVAQLRARLDEYGVDFKLRGLDDLRYGRLLEQHPPLKDAAGAVVERDKDSLWNRATFPSALVRASVVEPALDDEDWLVLLGDDETQGVLTASQLDELATVAFRLTRYSVDVPFSSAASRTTRNSGPA